MGLSENQVQSGEGWNYEKMYAGTRQGSWECMTINEKSGCRAASTGRDELS